MDVPTFRSTFPEFGTSPGVGVFSDTRITFWLTLGMALMNTTVWGNLYDHGLALFIAHHLAIDNTNQNAASNGANIGQLQGPVSSKSVGPASISYDTGASAMVGAGHWNLTSYGAQFYKLLRMVGAGGVSL